MLTWMASWLGRCTWTSAGEIKHSLSTSFDTTEPFDFAEPWQGSLTSAKRGLFPCGLTTSGTTCACTLALSSHHVCTHCLFITAALGSSQVQ